MDFRLESWRKLYLRENLDQQGWPLFARGLRDLLVRLAKDDGTVVARTTSPADDLAATLKASPDEWPMVVDAAERMLVDGYLLHETGRLFIARHEDAQARCTSTARVRKHRAKAAETAGSETLPKRVTKHQSGTDPTRPDPTRPDPTDPPIVPQGKGAASAGGASSSEVRRVWEHFLSCRRFINSSAPPKLNDTRRKHIRARLRSYGMDRVILAVTAMLARDSWYVAEGRITPEMVFRSDEQLEKHENVGGSRSEREWATTKAAENRNGGRFPDFGPDDDGEVMPDKDCADAARKAIATIGAMPEVKKCEAKETMKTSTPPPKPSDDGSSNSELHDHHAPTEPS